MRVIHLDGTVFDLPDPAEVSPGIYPDNASDAGRDEAGVMHNGLKGYDRKYKITWSGLTPAQVSQILTAFDPENVYVVLHDPKENKLKKRLYYAGDRISSLAIWSSRRKLYKSVSLSIIEANRHLATDYTVN